jgi:hypothetical protein
MQSALLFETVVQIFERAFRELNPGAALPDLSVQFYPYANLNSTIRMDSARTRIKVRLSDVLEEAPAPVQEALAHILLAKLYRKPVPEKYSQRYRLFVNRADVRGKALLLRRVRGRKQIVSAAGGVYDLEQIFDDLSQRFFAGALARPALSWSPRPSRRMLGHWDPAHNAIIISSVFDRPDVPRFVVEYIVYHEMLHIKHPAEYRYPRRCVHTPAFKSEERLFPRYSEAVRFVKSL